MVRNGATTVNNQEPTSLQATPGRYLGIGVGVGLVADDLAVLPREYFSGRPGDPPTGMPHPGCLPPNRTSRPPEAVHARRPIVAEAGDEDDRGFRHARHCPL